MLKIFLLHLNELGYVKLTRSIGHKSTCYR